MGDDRKKLLLSEQKYTVREAAIQTHMSESWWRRAILERRVVVLRIGRRVLIPESTIMELYEVAVVEGKVA